jgi:hypothetical protein
MERIPTDWEITMDQLMHDSDIMEILRQALLQCITEALSAKEKTT